MDFWPEFLASTWGKEFVAGGIGGMAGIVSGYPLDTLRIRMQQPPTLALSTAGAAAIARRPTSAIGLLRSILASEGPSALYRGMGAPLASVTFQNAMVFQVYAILSRAFDSNSTNEPPSYQSVALSGIGTGALQSLLLSPVELVKIKLQLQMVGNKSHQSCRLGPIEMAKEIIRKEGIPGLYRGLLITVLRDAPAHGVYFWSYEYAREQLHPGCRKGGQESLGTMLLAGGLAGVASWIFCYPLDVVKSRLQAQSKPQAHQPSPKYLGIVDCFRKSVQEEGVSVLFRGLGTAVTRAFVVNGAIFVAYESALRSLVNGNQRLTMEDT
ncbi:mitochondrial arginine transporter BAC2-like [Canna indica]|uniref:Mitochondrial arginine transporter BAC2-like n=1 Tax=Canna indica TaxID=4628 RepID=A0AAQ3K6N9_9LILI|nr:mitochondrial arginine transporter BAC2-like [Canna indica]